MLQGFRIAATPPRDQSAELTWGLGWAWRMRSVGAVAQLLIRACLTVKQLLHDTTTNSTTDIVHTTGLATRPCDRTDSRVKPALMLHRTRLSLTTVRTVADELVPRDEDEPAYSHAGMRLAALATTPSRSRRAFSRPLPQPRPHTRVCHDHARSLFARRARSSGPGLASRRARSRARCGPTTIVYLASRFSSSVRWRGADLVRFTGVPAAEGPVAAVAAPEVASAGGLSRGHTHQLAPSCQCPRGRPQPCAGYSFHAQPFQTCLGSE